MTEADNRLRAINRRHEFSVAIVLAALLLVLTLIQSTSSPVNQHQTVAQIDNSQRVTASPPDARLDKEPTATPGTKKQLITTLERSIDHNPAAVIDTQRLIAWVNKDEYSKARHYLIQQAANAVDEKNNSLLGNIILLLARVSATQGDLASTEVYLFEALDIFQQLGDATQMANSQLLIGQMYAKRRQIAQKAGWAYGDLLLARFYLSQGSPNDAKRRLESSIADNLKLGRAGAVASAYKTMARYYRTVNDTSGEQASMIEAGKFYANSGQSTQALLVLKQLRQRQAPLDLIESLQMQISQLLDQYESQINLVRQARDYMQLYSLYNSKGEHGRAWQFRVKASEILSRTEKRDMYFRAPDVMALLYDSNFNVTRAEKYYAQAGQQYLKQNDMQAYQQVIELKNQLN